MQSNMANGRAAEILLVEDNDNDVELTSQGFRRAKMLVNLHRVRDGEECMEFLRKQHKYAEAPTPDLVLLDLNMPKMSGEQVFAAMLKDDKLSSLPVVILSTSEQAEEVLKMYKMRCNSYIVKPVDFNQFLKVVQAITEYWFTVVALPQVTLIEKATARAGA